MFLNFVQSSLQDYSYNDAGTIVVLGMVEVKLNLYGLGLTNDTFIKLTTAKKEYGQDCKSAGAHVQTAAFPITTMDGGDGNIAVVAFPGLQERENAIRGLILLIYDRVDKLLGSDSDRFVSTNIFHFFFCNIKTSGNNHH
jgi:hypothetical protein